MREIKFRAWNYEDEKYYYFNVDNEDDMMLWYDIQTIKNEIYKRKELFTGLKDKNGKDIYEGDIVKTFWVSTYWSGGNGVITWRPKSCCFKIINGNSFCGINNRPEVIGNIYENPELLEEGE